MWDAEVVKKAIAGQRQDAADALAAIQVGHETGALVPEGMELGARYLGIPVEEFWFDTLHNQNMLDDFVLALQARGIPIEAVQVPDHSTTHWKEEELRAFLTRATAFRCRILADGEVRGSGILVGPSSVLTAWHVIAVAPPDEEQKPAPRIEVQLVNGKRVWAGLRYHSLCGKGEYESRLPASDKEIIDRNDLVLLSLREPAGLHLNFASLPPQPCECRNRAAFMLIHYPEGRYEGIQFGKFVRVRTVTGRWGHDIIDTAPGSSGGGCFDTSYLLAGLHQGRRQGSGGRLVPTIRFADAIRDHIARDEIPDTVWSLDGTITGELVVGRETFFHAFAAAARGPARVRGLWVQRTDPRNDISGLPFSHRLLDRMIARSSSARLVTIGFEELVPDLPNEIARRVAAAGFLVETVTAVDGVGALHTEPEAMLADRSRRLALAIDAAARAAGIRLWLFFDHPRVIFGDEHRWALSAFVQQALSLDGLRLAIAGYEAMQMPGTKFNSSVEAEGEGMPGLMVEYLNGFTLLDVENLIRKAAMDMGRKVSDERVKELATAAVAGMKVTNEVFFESWMGAEVRNRLRPELSQLAEGGATP